MIKVIDVNSRIEFVSSFDKTEPKTVFYLKPLSGIEMMSFTDGHKEDIFNMVISSVVDVKDYPVEGKTVSEIINSLSITVLGELITKINSINNVTEQDQKN